MFQCEVCGSVFLHPVQEMNTVTDALGLAADDAPEVCPGCGSHYFSPFDEDIDH